MRKRAILYALSLAAMFTILGCATTTPKREFVLGHDPLMDQNGGVLLMVDSCILREAMLKTNDCYVVAESKAAAQELLRVSRKYLFDNGVQIHSELIPFVCGALHDANNSPQRVADRIDGPVSMTQQPFCIANEFSNDQEYVTALRNLSTYAFQNAKGPKTTKAANAGATAPSSTGHPQYVAPGDLKTAAALISARTSASSVLYLGMLGKSRTTEKAIAQDVGDVLVGAAIGLVLGNVVYVPSHNDTSEMCAGLLNLDSGELIWSNCTSPIGDPAKPGTIAQPMMIEALLFDLVHRPKATKPGEEK